MTYLMATWASPIRGDADNPVVIGPFADQAELDEFLDRHDRVFSTICGYTPSEYTEAVVELHKEDA